MDDSDDDAPLVFKRNNTSAKQKLEIKKPSSQKSDVQSGKQASEARSLNGQSFNPEKNRPIAPEKSSQEKSSTNNIKPSNSSAKSPPIGNLKASSSSASQSKPTPTIKEKSPAINTKTSNSSAKSPLIGNLKASSSSADNPKRPPLQKPSSTIKEKSSTNIIKPSSSSAKSPPIGNLKTSSSSADQSKNPPSQKPTPIIKEKSPINSSKTSNSSAKSPLIGNIKSSTSSADQSKRPPIKKPTSDIKEEKNSIIFSVKSEDDSEDSEDNKPLSARMPSGSSKVNFSHTNKEVNNSNKNSNVKNEDSDDEVPLASKFNRNDEKKPIGSSVHQNGGSTKDAQIKKSSIIANKRPLGDVNNSNQSSIKKPKIMDESLPSSSMQAPSKPKKEIMEDEDEDEDHLPISQRIKKASISASKSSSEKKNMTKVVTKTSFKKTGKMSKKTVKKSKFSKSSKMQPGSGEGQKWNTLVHSGVIFPPPYTPHGVKMLYKGKPVDLSPEQEEVATMYAVMLETDYMTKPKFKENFMTDWRKILGKNHVIQKLEDCDFKPIYEWHQTEKEKKKQMTTEEKKAIKEEKLKQEEKYMWAIVDGVKEKVGNFRVEPPGLFRGRGEHPKMGKLKKRIKPSDITINIGKNCPIPECPVPGESWREVRHDNTVTWLAFWNDPINPKEFKYVFLAASSSLKGQSDKEKYEKARTLKHYIQGIRTAYTKDFTNKDVTKRQIAIATYLIDKLALRAGNEKDDDEADTVGCCTLKVENVEPIPPHTLKFDFLGKDSIRYQNEVEVELPVFKAIQQFRVGKKGSDNLFDQLDTSKLNAVLKELMPGLTAKVFRTYNASITLDEMLSKGTKGGDVAEKVVVYQHANKEVAIICNHQRTVSKTHSAQMTRLNDKIDELKASLDELKTDLARAKKGKPPLKGSDGKNKRNLNPEALERKIAQTNAKIEKMERDKDAKEDLKTVALGTSKINYLDPRITVAWCKRFEVPIEKMFNKALLAKFAWAMDVEPDFRF